MTEATYRIKPPEIPIDEGFDRFIKTHIGTYRLAVRHDTKMALAMAHGHLLVKNVSEDEAISAIKADYEARLKKCLVEVVKVECGDCVHHHKEVTGDGITLFPCLQFPKGQEQARLGPCDNGRNGEPIKETT